jgi:hypothetical protein
MDWRKLKGTTSSSLIRVHWSLKLFKPVINTKRILFKRFNDNILGARLILQGNKKRQTKWRSKDKESTVAGWWSYTEDNHSNREERGGEELTLVGSPGCTDLVTPAWLKSLYWENIPKKAEACGIHNAPGVRRIQYYNEHPHKISPRCIILQMLIALISLSGYSCPLWELGLPKRTSKRL